MRRNPVIALLIIASIFVIAAGLQWSASVVGPILFAITITLLVWPALAWLRKKGVPKGLAVAIVAVAAILVAGVIILLVASSLRQLSANIPQYTVQLNARLQPLTGRLSASGFNPGTWAQGAGIDSSKIAETAVSFARGFVDNVYSVIMFLVTLFLMIVVSEDVVRRYKEIYGEKTGFAAQFATWSKSVQVQYRVQASSNLISAVLTTALFFALGVDFPILWGVLAFVLAYVPNVGLVIASIPPVILTFILHGWQLALLAIALIWIINYVMDNVVTPNIMGKQLEVPSIFVLISFIICSFLFGILGAFLSLPLLLALRQALALHPQTKGIAQLLGADGGREEKHGRG